MNNYKLKTMAGDQFNKVAEQAKSIASMDNFKGNAVEFDFNGIKCVVNKTTNLEWLWRDYTNAHRMDWKVIGADCEPFYEPEVQAELDRRNKEAEEKSEQQRKEWETKDKAEREVFEAKTKGVELELTDVNGWNDWKGKNTDGYGAAIFEYAEGWAKLMQVEMSSGKKLVECAEPTSFQLGFLGITGFMYGAAVSILSQCWKYGEALRKWHNKEYGYEGDGTINPAILAIQG